jgi:cell fate (sporulation/competence/biofilm development) regulator YlbF (YheA/YmcA/DUF963 family)
VFGEDTGIEFKEQVPTGIQFANDLDVWYDEVSKRGIKPTDNVSKVFKSVYEGVGIAAVDLPLMSKIGLPGFSALTSGGEAIGAGGDDVDVAKSTAIGGIHGMLLHGVLQSAGFLPRGVRVPLVGSIFGGESLRAEMDKLPEERDYPRVVADFIIGGGLTFPGKGLSVAELKRTPRVIEAARRLKEKVEQDRILEAIDTAERVKALRGDELGISGYGEQNRIVVDRENTIRPFEKLNEAERKAVRDVDMEQLPPTIEVPGGVVKDFEAVKKAGFDFALELKSGKVIVDKEVTAHFEILDKHPEILDKDVIDGIFVKGKKKFTRDETRKELEKAKIIKRPDIKVKFIDEEVVEGNKPVEMYEMEIGGVKSEFFVSRAKGENVRDGITEQLRLYTDPMLPEGVRDTAAEALYNSNFGLQRKLNEQYHEWVRGEVKEKMKKEFKDSVVVDEDGNPIRLYHGTTATFKKFDPNFANTEALFGPGFYFTSDQNVAGGYAEIGVKTGGSIKTMFLNMKNPLDMEKLYTEKESTDIINNYSNFWRKKREGDIFIQRKVKNILEAQGGMTGRALRQALLDIVPKDIVEVKKEGLLSVFNKSLKGAGFDGIKHTGGKITGGVEHDVYIAFDSKQILDIVESFAKHREKIIKNQPAPPQLGARALTFQQLLEILPRRFGGKRPNDKPIVDVFAEVKQEDLISDLVLAKEQALNQVLPDIKTYNTFIKNYQKNKKSIDRRMKEGNKSLDKLRVWVADTGLLFASKLGKAGGSAMQLGIDGHNKEIELYKVAGFHRDKLVDIYKKADWNELERDMVDVSIVKALEDRANAKSYFVDKEGKLNEEAFEIYEIMQNHFDVMEKHIAATGRPTIDNYFTRTAERAGALDQLLSGLESDNFISVQDALAGKVNSPFLKERSGELEKYRHDVLNVFDIYNSSVIKTLAYEDLIKYYTSTFRKSSEGSFGADVPPELAGTPSFFKMRTEVNKWVRGLVEPEYMYGPVGKFVMKIRRNTYETFLKWNLRAGLDNSTQDMFILAFTPAETHQIYRNVYKQRKRFEKEAPALSQALQQAGKDKTYLLEIAESDIARFSKTKKKTGVRNAMSKISELDPFFMWERANWAKAEVAGLVEYAFKQPGWESAVKKHKGDYVKAVEEIISSEPIHQRRSVVSARQLSWQTQLMAGNVASPHIFRTELGKILGMFKRFGFGQVENMIRSFQQSGTDGIAAVRMLARGFPDEIQSVETLRSIETLRKGIEATEQLARKFPNDVDVNLNVVTKMRKSVTAVEKELNNTIKRLQPINKNNKSTQTRLWAKYAAKRWAYAFMYNVMASMVLDFLGFGMSDAYKSQDPLERATAAASRNLIPFFWDVRNPSRLVAPPIIPDTGGAFGGKRQYLKGMVEWGFNSVKYAGVINRLSNRMLSNAVTDLIVPKENEKNVKF